MITHPSNASPPKTILVVRNDKLGDFMLAWPAFAALKGAFPEARILALVPKYTKDIAALCPWIDEILIDSADTSSWSSFFALRKQLSSYRCELMVTLFSTNRVGLLGKLAGIPQRWAPATKLAQVFYNHRLKQKRSQSLQPEYQYNQDLALAAIKSYYPNYSIPPQNEPWLHFEASELEALKLGFCAEHAIDSDQQLVFVHAGHGGSANNLSLEQYAQLIQLLNAPKRSFVLTAGPGELEDTQRLSALLSDDINHCVFNSTEGLKSFAKHLALANLFIAGSTGTLHIAGALDVPTAGFYPNRRSSTPLRWQTLNSEGRYIAFTPPTDIEQDMSHVDIEGAAQAIKAFVDKL